MGQNCISKIAKGTKIKGRSYSNPKRPEFWGGPKAKSPKTSEDRIQIYFAVSSKFTELLR